MITVNPLYTQINWHSFQSIRLATQSALRIAIRSFESWSRSTLKTVMHAMWLFSHFLHEKDEFARSPFSWLFYISWVWCRFPTDENLKFTPTSILTFLVIKTDIVLPWLGFLFGQAKLKEWQFFPGLREAGLGRIGYLSRFDSKKLRCLQSRTKSTNLS